MAFPPRKNSTSATHQLAQPGHISAPSPIYQANKPLRDSTTNRIMADKTAMRDRPSARKPLLTGEHQTVSGLPPNTDKSTWADEDDVNILQIRELEDDFSQAQKEGLATLKHQIESSIQAGFCVFTIDDVEVSVVKPAVVHTMHRMMEMKEAAAMQGFGGHEEFGYNLPTPMAVFKEKTDFEARRVLIGAVKEVLRLQDALKKWEQKNAE